jgi:SagB-type dehydrogenase family enzyme
MNTSKYLVACSVVVALIVGAAATSAQDMTPIELPAPDMAGGKPLMQALAERSSSREFSEEQLPGQVLSDLLWAACGVNRPESGKRTAPTAMNMLEIDVYVATADGLFLYDAAKHILEPVLAGDIRAATGRQDFVAVAPVNLVYVADLSKMTRGDEEQKKFYSATDTGFISQNVYLFCASEGLVTVVRGAVDKESLAEAMKLRPDQKVILAQTVGYPKK